MAIENVGGLMQHILAGVEQNNATPFTEIRVRIGSIGPTYRISHLNGSMDQRGFSLMLELEPFPESF